MATSTRGQWASKFGFIMAAAGSAVGLGNIWRFPYLTGENGGAAFVLVYVGCVILIGAPMLINEIALGRLTGKNPVGAFQHTGANRWWTFLGGVLPLVVTFVVLSYYSIIAGWTVGYIITSLFSIETSFTAFIANPTYVVPLGVFVMLVTVLIVLGGVSGGIEKATKIMMPLLFVLLLIVIGRSLTLPGAEKGVAYYLIPDFSKINGMVVLKALTQAFFSLGIGWGMMITYGSYLPKNQNIVSSSLWVGLMDTSVALLAGLMVFPAVFAFNMSPSQGPTLVFSVLANIFQEMPLGNLAGALFFLLLFLAAITSTISMLEAPAAYFMDTRKWSRKKAAWVVATAAFLVGIPAALSNGSSDFFTSLSLTVFGETKKGFMDIMDYVFGTLFMMVVVLATCIYSGWLIKTSQLVDEIAQGSPRFTQPIIGGLTRARLWTFTLRFVCPVVIGLIILNLFGAFG
ncbi:MAG: sodium-dependent transporter [Cyclobacteriaceae bacterium]|jgi:NSS family neurotransmitter:Na+ symporter|nr:sodium-dependent transporter [Cyclobacteriaceae bacterium]